VRTRHTADDYTPPCHVCFGRGPIVGQCRECGMTGCVPLRREPPQPSVRDGLLALAEMLDRTTFPVEWVVPL